MTHDTRHDIVMPLVCFELFSNESTRSILSFTAYTQGLASLLSSPMASSAMPNHSPILDCVSCAVQTHTQLSAHPLVSLRPVYWRKLKVYNAFARRSLEADHGHGLILLRVYGRVWQHAPRTSSGAFEAYRSSLSFVVFSLTTHHARCFFHPVILQHSSVVALMYTFCLFVCCIYSSRLVILVVCNPPHITATASSGQVTILRDCLGTTSPPHGHINVVVNRIQGGCKRKVFSRHEPLHRETVRLRGRRKNRSEVTVVHVRANNFAARAVDVPVLPVTRKGLFS